MNDIAEAIARARALIERPEWWTQRWFARDKIGVETGAHDRWAVCWCAAGALARASVPAFASNFVRDEMDGDITTFNDSHTHEEVLAAFDRAIKRAGER